ncbi:MAG TPA: prephenate dehydratase [Cytophagales bacterium]|nr:prephenate dehydratase [Cytophagales bacterium]
MIVAIQGGDASFHDIAARKYFSNVSSVIKCATFREVFEALKKGTATNALIAIENTIAGSILGNYTLLQEYGFPIIGEIRLRIIMCLMALKGQQISDLNLVKSHYMALLQCNDFLQNYPHIKVEEFHDTADSAKDIKENQLKGVGAIAGKYASELYDLQVLAESIETYKMNFTRFLVISADKSHKVENPNKASIALVINDKPGALSKILRQFDEYGINLTKIQSIPLLGSLDQYTFYIDCEWEQYESYIKSIDSIKSLATEINILGTYKKGEVIYGN